MYHKSSKKASGQGNILIPQISNNMTSSFSRKCFQKVVVGDRFDQIIFGFSKNTIRHCRHATKQILRMRGLIKNEHCHILLVLKTFRLQKGP